MNISLLSLALIQSFLLAMGQVMLKFGLLRMEPFGWNLSFWRSALVNWQFALCGLCFGAIPTNLKVGLKGGSVTLTKSNVWITLSPYFFPFWTAVVGLVALIVRCFVSPLPFTGAWLFVVGFTLGLHVCFTLRAILQEQPDLQEYGYVFSYVLIGIFNVAGVIAWIVCTSEVTWGAVWGRLLVRSARAYAAVGRGCLWIYESVRTLPFLQG